MGAILHRYVTERDAWHFKAYDEELGWWFYEL